MTCVKTVEVVKDNSKKGDQVAVYASIETFHSTVKIIEETVQHEEFDNKSAVRPFFFYSPAVSDCRKSDCLFSLDYIFWTCGRSGGIL